MCRCVVVIVLIHRNQYDTHFLSQSCQNCGKKADSVNTLSSQISLSSGPVLGPFEWQSGSNCIILRRPFIYYPFQNRFQPNRLHQNDMLLIVTVGTNFRTSYSAYSMNMYQCLDCNTKLKKLCEIFH